ncbi:MAG: AAA family ATPase [Phycisphaerae bacterium]|nr:AAA family ATPase [Phycisphaerae bacterium]
MADFVEDLQLLIRSRYPIITIETDEERRALDRVLQAVRSLAMQAYIWDMVEGLRATTPAPTQSIPKTKSPKEVLTHILSTNWSAVFILKDLCTHLRDAALQRMLRTFSQNAHEHHRTMILIDPSTDLPDILGRISAPLEISLPDEDELEQIARSTFKELSRYSKIRSELNHKQFRHIVRMLRGLTAHEARLAVSRVILDDDCLNSDDIERLLKVKREMVRESGVLEYIDSEIRMEDIGGLTNLKRWLTKRAGALSPKAREFGLEPPRGILMLGVQGCGKSAACKAVAAAWQMPLLKLDPGQLYNKYVGESEHNLRKAIKQAESMAPVILWIDEIEKAFASASAESADGGLSKRMFGTLLNWLQDHPSPIFTVATANDISALPPELVRKGRFDEVFFVDLPDHETREHIFAIHLRNRKRPLSRFDLGDLAGAAEGFSGAEIEQAIVGALYSAFGQSRSLTQEDILNEIQDTRPLSVTMAEKVSQLRAWAANRCVPAD